MDNRMTNPNSDNIFAIKTKLANMLCGRGHMRHEIPVRDHTIREREGGTIRMSLRSDENRMKNVDHGGSHRVSRDGETARLS